MNNEFINKSIVDGLISTSINSKFPVFGRIENRYFSTISAISGDMGNRVDVKVSYRALTGQLAIGFKLGYGAPVASYNKVEAFFDGVRKCSKDNFSALMKEFSGLCGVILSSLPDRITEGVYFKLGVAFAWAYTSPDMVKKGWFLYELCNYVTSAYMDGCVTYYLPFWFNESMKEKGVYETIIDDGLLKIGKAFSMHSSYRRYDIMRKAIESFSLLGEAYSKFLTKFGVDYLTNSLRVQIASRYLQPETIVLMDVAYISQKWEEYMDVSLCVGGSFPDSSEGLFDAIRNCR